MAERKTLGALVPFEQQLELDAVAAQSVPRRRRRVGAPKRDPGRRRTDAERASEPADAPRSIGSVGGPGIGPYLLVEDVAERLRCSTRTVHELTRTSSIPHRRLPGTRRCLFRRDELEAWENGSALQVKELPRGGRVVTPCPTTA
jgi:excisionase family DNA binding protein